MQDAPQYRFSLGGGLFESITMTMHSTTDWSTLLVQLLLRGVIDFTGNSNLFCMLVNLLAILTQPALIKRSYLAHLKRLMRRCRTPAP